MKLLKKNLVTATILCVLLLAVSTNTTVQAVQPSYPPGQGPKMKTLDNVEPRIPIGEDTTPGDANYEYIISNSGSYYLTEDVNTSKSGIKVDANDVTIDLMGYLIKGPGSGTNNGIYMNQLSNVEIRNGTVRDFYRGIYAESTNNRNHRLIGVRAVYNGNVGIMLDGMAHLIKYCTANNNGASSAVYVYAIYSGARSTVTGNTVYGNGKWAIANSVYGIFTQEGCVVIDNTVSYNGEHVSTYSNIVSGIEVGPGSVVAGNTVNRNGILASGLASLKVSGIKAGFGSTLTGNTTTFNGANAVSECVYGIYATGACTVNGNTAYYNGGSATGSVYGIYADEGCTVADNTVYKNGDNAGTALCKVCGIYANSGSKVTGNMANNNGRSTSSEVYGILTGTGSIVSGNTACYNGESAIKSDRNSVHGIYADSGSMVTGNSAGYNGDSAHGQVFGIYAYAGCKVAENVAYYNGSNVTYTGGISAFGIFAYTGCTVIGNTARGNGIGTPGVTYGLYLSSNSLIDQNTAYNNEDNNMNYPSNSTYGINHAP